MAKKLHEREEDEDSKMMWSKIFLDWRVGESSRRDTRELESEMWSVWSDASTKE